MAEIYDLLEPERPDLEPYLAMAREFAARRVLDIGCGTGTFACLLAEHGVEVMGVDPAAASLEVARRKSGSERVLWIRGDATAVPPTQVDLVTMTGNVAQVFVTDEAWSSSLGASYGSLRPGGRLVFETRDPDKEAWRAWTRNQTYRYLELPDVGGFETWIEVTEVAMPLVRFRHHFLFHSDGEAIVSESCLRFRSRSQVAASLIDTGFSVDEICDAPDRPGRELVFIAVRKG